MGQAPSTSPCPSLDLLQEPDLCKYQPQRKPRPCGPCPHLPSKMAVVLTPAPFPRKQPVLKTPFVFTQITTPISDILGCPNPNFQVL